MTLSFDECSERLRAGDHGVLATMHATRGADLVPVVYAVAGERVGVPIDLVKPKASTRLQRERNLELDPRATLLIEQWDRDDWSALWWVRAQLRWLGPTAPGDELADRLAARHEQYRDRPFARVLVFEVDTLTGWSAYD